MKRLIVLKKIDRNVIKEQAAEKKQRQTINRVVKNAEMSKQEAIKAVEELKNNESTPKRERKQIDYAALADKKFRTKK